MDYLDFDLYISRTQEGYHVRASNAFGASASADFVLPFTDDQIENLMLRVGRRRRSIRRIESPETKAAKAFGGKLYGTVFRGEVFGLWRTTLSTAPEGRVRLRLHLLEVPELSDLPWEYLYDGARNQFVALLVKTPIVRFLDLPTPIQPLLVRPPLRILVVLADATDYEPLDVEREWSNISRATQKLQERGLLTLTRLQEGSFVALFRALRDTEFHILHFVGHGAFIAGEQDGVLVFRNEAGRGQLVGSQLLGMVLANFDSLRLVVLNACEGARNSRHDPFAGIAPSLIQQDKPAVVAMQFEVSDQAAITFADEFYGALSQGIAVDASLAFARMAILTGVNDLEWGTPVLYMRAPNGVIFDIKDEMAPLPSSLQESIPNFPASVAKEKMQVPESSVVATDAPVTAEHSTSDTGKEESQLSPLNQRIEEERPASSSSSKSPEAATNELAEPEPSGLPAAEVPSSIQMVSETTALQPSTYLDSEAMLQIAREKREAGNTKEALELYERIMHRRPNLLKQVTGDLEAIVAYGKAPLTTHRLLGEAYAMAGRFKESLEQYRIAMGK